MAKIYKICITEKFGGEMIDVNSVEVIAKKGIVNDRYFKNNNKEDIQITLIESENIDYFNEKSQTNFPYLDFRRNIVTKGIKLNQLIGKEILIGKVKIKGHRLCDPCKYLHNKLQQNSLLKNMVHLYQRGGLRCEILTNGKIFINDLIKSD